ncbi:hypothetical protein [Tersicoccus sp. Bi-70]|nr:hypothetical protein [Tersicoccus sp. Bi-70]
MTGPLGPRAVDAGPATLRLITLRLVTPRGIEHDAEADPWP